MDTAQNATVRSLRRLQVAFALLSVALLAVLAVAPAESHFSEWRKVQQRYNVLARRAHRAPIEVRIRQVASPTGNQVDRCGSCHLGAAGVSPLAGDPLFRPHPPIPHDPARFGCTVCHGGQGRAVTMADAHGDGPSWGEPLIPSPYREAGCGRCHARVPLPDPERADRGRALFDAGGCSGCHTVDGRAAKGMRDLSEIGLRGFAADWQARHARDAGRSTDPRWSSSVLRLEPAQRTAIEAYLETLVGAPDLVAGKLLVAKLGCRGCHRIDGVGGDGPDLSDLGSRRVSDVDFSRVPGQKTIVAWLRALLTDPSRLNPRSAMPTPHLSPSEMDRVITYLLALQASESADVALAFRSRDGLKGELLGERDFPVEGRPLFVAFCSACHGDHGQGRALGSERAVAFAPAVGGPAFLAIADDAFVTRTVKQGRPDHMPAWGAGEGGLRPAEIDAVVRYLRSLQPRPPSFVDVWARDFDAERGRAVFAQSCAPCHGAEGEGTAIAPPLAAPDNGVTSRAEAIYGTLVHGVDRTAMGSFRTIDAVTLRAVIGTVLGLDRRFGARAGWHPRPGDASRGRALFARYCVDCHGPRPGGRVAPAIDDPRVTATLSDSFLTASIVRRHDRTHDGLRRSADEVADLVAYLRSLGPLHGPPHAK